MVIDIKMCRFDNVPWGFRLVGGADYDYPLTVVKVTEGSIAEEAGLCVEDIIVRINDTAATPLTHDEAHRLILGSGSVFYFGVYREHEEELLADGPLRFPVSASSLTKSPSPGRSEMSLSLASLPSLTEATKALMPEEEQQQFETATELEVDAECRRAMTEMHAVEGEGQPEQQEEQEQQEERQSELQPVEVDNLYLPDLPDRPCSVLSEQSEIKLVEEEIAAVLSGESEVLKEHNVLGIFPKPGVCMTSDVLRSLNEEVTKTKQEKEKENRKWSTFLQRPDRPVPKSRQQLEAERRAANAYKVKIVKSAPRDKSPMPEAKPEVKTETEAEAETVAKETSPEAAELKAEEQPEEQKEKEEEEEPLPTDSEVPNLEQLPENDNGGEVANAEADGEQLEKADASKEEPQQVREAVEEEAATEVEVKETTPPKTDEELALEKQLSDVQKQLAALSSLPSTIQSTLDAVTKQLAELLPTFKLQQQQQQQLPQIDEGEQQAEAEEEVEKEQKQPDQLAAGENEDSRNVAAPCENNEDKCDANDLEVAEFSHSNGDNRELDEQLSEQQTLKKQKKHNVIEELEEHLVRKNNPKRSKRAFGPLTPSSERPLVLPGGRRWYRPKDAYNDEFIAETLSAQAELITGSTLGCPYESPLLGYDARVNFMKYQKPERKIDLNRSEVYKVVHHLDRAPLHGIEVRAPLVAAESDIRQALES
ncbi:neurofilament medium polypeptide isoform X2 [Drosophila sulfurigaster albostrigata]|uniref:neurofilament medium polypeptide isoform X2 n=1 Tax=Drosophila sulfurigaster albostrigata TaxID=89887 RepID=UPI002D21B2E2|nr:neurofilament medium polypeptide isoform X2 [Drosophila sulfurigaster albostrigata]